MKRIIIIVIILLILVLCSIAIYDNFIDKSKNLRLDIRGTVTNITRFDDVTTILVEGQIENDTSYDKASIRIYQNTLITNLALNNNIDMSEIKVGDKVEVMFKDEVALSYPVQAIAELVHIIE